MPLNRLLLLASAFELLWLFAAQSFRLCPEIIWIYQDSLHTAERSRQMLVSNDPLTVKRNFYRDHRKPPLQYWLTAPLLKTVPDVERALTLWPLLFGILCLGLTGILAWQLLPEDQWLPLATLALLGTSTILLASASIAYLDTGMTAFLLLSAVGYEAARKDPAAWWLVGAGIVLGFLQKVPLGLIYVALVLVSDRLRHVPVAPWRNTSFRAACWVWGSLALIWPLHQVIRFGGSYGRNFFQKEMFSRVINERPNDLGLAGIIGQIFEHWPWVMVCAFAGLLLWGILSFRKNAFPQLTAPCLFLNGYLVFVAFFLQRERYLLPAAPFAALFAAWFLFRAFKGFKLSPAPACLLVYLASLAGVWQWKGDLLAGKESKDLSKKQGVLEQRAVGEAFRQIRQEDESAVIFSAKGESDQFMSGMSFFAAQPDALHFWVPKKGKGGYKKIEPLPDQKILVAAKPEDMAAYPLLFPDRLSVGSAGRYELYRANKAAIGEMDQRRN